jgi:hypothetical protein
MLIRGSDLNAAQRRQVLNAFIYRWTHENARQNYRGQCPGCVQNRRPASRRQMSETEWHAHHLPLISDEQWLAEHAFHFTADGSRLARNRQHAEPAHLVTYPAPRGKGAGFDYPETPCTQCGRPMNPAERMLGPVCGVCTRENHERVTGHRPARPRPTHRPRPRGAHPVVRTLADLKRLPLGTRVYVSYPGATIHGNLGSTAIAPVSGVLKSLASVRAGFMEWRTEEGPKAGTLSRLTFASTKIIPTADGFDLAENGEVFARYTFAE